LIYLCYINNYTNIIIYMIKFCWNNFTIGFVASSCCLYLTDRYNKYNNKIKYNNELRKLNDKEKIYDLDYKTAEMIIECSD
jgi:hypothetical protein